MDRLRKARAASWNTVVGSLSIALTLAVACDKGPNLAQEHVRQGDTALAEGRYSQAMVAYGHAHELVPTDPYVQHARMRVRVHLMAESPSRVATDVLEDVAYEAQLLLKIDKGREAVCLSALGNVLARRGDFDGARAKLAEAIKADPGSAVGHIALGTLLMSRREALAEAKLELEAALKIKPDSASALTALGQVQLAQSDFTGAVERLEASLRLGDDFTARMALGGARVQQGKPADAADQFRRAVQLDPKSVEALSSLGQALFGAGRLEEAEQALRAAAQMQRSEGTLIALGFVLARQKRSEQSLAVFGQILAENPGSPSALYGSGAASEDLGRTAQALDYYRRVLALPAEGSQKQLVDELRKEAEARVSALSAPPAPATSAAPRSPAPRR